MHTVGARALQSVAAAAAPTQVRRRMASRRPALGAIRGFLSSPVRQVGPEDLGAARDDDPRPEGSVGGGVGAADADSGRSSEAPTPTSSADDAAAANTPTPSVPVGVPVTAAATAPAIAITTTSTPPAELLKDALSSTGGRSRSARHRNQDGMPAVTLPDWFLKDHVRLHQSAPSQSYAASQPPAALSSDLAAASALMFPPASPATEGLDAADMTALSLQERDSVRQYLDAWLNGAAWDERKVAQAVAHLRNGPPPDEVARRGAAVAAAATYLTAALAYDEPHEAVAGMGGKLDPYNALGLPARPFGRAVQNAVQARLSKGTTAHTAHAVARDADDAVVRGIPASFDAGERLAFRELFSTVATELRAVSPAKAAKDLKRPVSVLAILNYKGRSKAVEVIDDVARSLSAHVVHLDADSIADIAGPYLGQSAYWARGNIALLGYAAAQKNGQMAPRYAAKDDDDADVSLTLSRIPMAFMKSAGGLSSRLSMKGAFASESDDRWDDLKINNILETMIRAADAAPASAPASSASAMAPASATATPSPGQTPHNLILHVHHFLELSSTAEGLQVLNKLRSIVDRLWQKGHRIVMVGSTSADMNAAPALLEKAEELRQEDCHIIPYRVAEGQATRALEAQDTVRTNMSNIRAMISALTGEPLAPIDVSLEAQWRGSVDAEAATELRAALSTTVFDIHWVYRFAAQILGSHMPHAPSPAPPPPPPPPPLSARAVPSWKHAIDERTFAQALWAMRDQDQMWKETAGAQEPYYSPLTVGREADGEAELGPEVRVDGVMRRVQAGDYTEYEKKFLSDLIDANDIRTTFADIVCPDDVKDSLKALTSLSLVRPEAFLYGVLAAERIPGCLLYGPPGTGKTLMAKAVAKQSGANMLEISAASINDMWVGNSEKNVQALFSLARKLSPVVIFLDEADALLGARTTRPGRGGHRETINQFLREWDGLTSNMKAFIMVATNRPFDLDEAVLRRLPRRILVDLPLRDARLAILRVMLRDELLDDASVSLDRLAADTELYSGSDLKNLCVAAAMDAVREEVRAQEAHTGPHPFIFPARRVLTGAHFERALQEIGASISEDMSSLQAIRRFDERYGDNSSKRRRKRRRGMGFEVAPGGVQTEEARVRQAV